MHISRHLHYTVQFVHITKLNHWGCFHHSVYWSNGKLFESVKLKIYSHKNKNFKCFLLLCSPVNQNIYQSQHLYIIWKIEAVFSVVNI